MALIKCPECTKEISDKALSCPNCGFPIVSDISLKGNSISKGLEDESFAKTEVEDADMQSKDNSESHIDALDDEKRKKTDEMYNKMNEIFACAFIVAIIGVFYLFINNVVAVLIFVFSAILFAVYNMKSNNLKNLLGVDYENYISLKTKKEDNNNNQKNRFLCPKCGSNDINISINTVGETYRGINEVRKKSAVTRNANKKARKCMILATGGLWALTPKKSDYKEIQKGKTVYNQVKICVCQKCGSSWNI